MASTFLIEYTRLQKYLGISTSDTASLVYLKQQLNDAYRTLCEAYDWPWLHYEAAVSLVGDYSTGTVTIVNDTTDYMTTTGTWSTAWSPVKVKTAAGHLYTLTYNSNNTRWEMDRDLVEAEAAVTYTLYKDRYTLPARMRSVYLAYTTVNPDWPAQMISPVQMAILKSGGVTVSNPVRAICFVDADTTNYASQIEVYPMPDSAHTLHLKGYRQVADLSADADIFAFPGSILSAFRHLALSYAYDWRANAERSAQEYQKYEVELARAIDRADPSAGADGAMVLDPHWFGSNDYRDERARA